MRANTVFAPAAHAPVSQKSLQEVGSQAGAQRASSPTAGGHLQSWLAGDIKGQPVLGANTRVSPAVSCQAASFASLALNPPTRATSSACVTAAGKAEEQTGPTTVPLVQRSTAPARAATSPTRTSIASPGQLGNSVASGIEFAEGGVGLHPGIPACVAVTSPVEGIVVGINVTMGQAVREGEAIACISVMKRGGRLVSVHLTEEAPGVRSESPPALRAGHQRERDHMAASPPPRSIVRQVSGVRHQVPSVGLPAPPGAAGPLSPLRGPAASPTSPHQTPSMIHRKASSSTTSFTLSCEGTQPVQPGAAATGDSPAVPQMTSRSSNGSGAAADATRAVGHDPNLRQVRIGQPVLSGSSQVPTSSLDRLALDRSAAGLDRAARGTSVTPANSVGEKLPGRRETLTVAEVVTDSRGDVLHRMCNVILLSPLTGDREQQLKVRGQIIGTYWDAWDAGPALEHPGEVQVMVTYVDASERGVALLYPSKHVQTFADTETTEGNVIKWRANLCKVGKKFS